jgi:hypothetical protein
MWDSTHHHSDLPRPRVDARVRRRLCAHPVRVAVDAALGRRGDQHSNLDAAVLVSRTIFCGPKPRQSEGGCFVCVCWIAFSRSRRAIEF